jgi:DNA-binding NtrC family response regulator
LVVEDDPHVRELAAALLEETRLDVVEVESAEAALNCLRERDGEVAMIFADIRLQGAMDGVQLAKEACTLWPTVRIVLTSGAASPPSRTCPLVSPSCPSLGAALMCWLRPRRPSTNRNCR